MELHWKIQELKESYFPTSHGTGFILGNIKNICFFLSKLKTEMAKIVEILVNSVVDDALVTSGAVASMATVSSYDKKQS